MAPLDRSVVVFSPNVSCPEAKKPRPLPDAGRTCRPASLGTGLGGNGVGLAIRLYVTPSELPTLPVVKPPHGNDWTGAPRCTSCRRNSVMVNVSPMCAENDAGLLTS